MRASSVAPPNPAWRVTVRVRPRQEMGEQKHSAGRVFTPLCSLPSAKDLQYPTADHSLPVWSGDCSQPASLWLEEVTSGAHTILTAFPMPMVNISFIKLPSITKPECAICFLQDTDRHTGYHLISRKK